MKKIASLALALAVGVVGHADARPRIQYGGAASSTTIFLPPTGGTRACDPGGSGVCAQFQSGQTFVTWKDKADGLAGNSWRYKVVRATTPITAGNYTSATEIAGYITNNSAQLFGGDPDYDSLGYFNQTYRQNTTYAMTRLTNFDVAGSAPLPKFSGLQVHTALLAQDAYYAVIGMSGSGFTTPTYIGSVGPIAETVGTPQAIKIKDNASRATTTGKFTLPPSSLPLIIRAHQSGTSSGCRSNNCMYGDYWNLFMPADSSTWQEGRSFVFSVMQQNFVSVGPALHMSHRETIMDPLGNVPVESFHEGYGLSPNPAVGPANRFYISTHKAIAREAAWAIAHYNVDPNNVHWYGISMGAWGGAHTGLRMSIPGYKGLASVWAASPGWQMDNRNSSGWAGIVMSSAWPFMATLGTGNKTLGTDASAVLTSWGERWGGPGGYADTQAFVASNPGQDLPFIGWWKTYEDGKGSMISEDIRASDAFTSAHRGFAWSFTHGGHNTGGDHYGVIDCDFGSFSVVGLCYGKNLFKLNLPYIAFSNSSIDDDPGTNTPGVNGLIDGDLSGCINCGNKWTVSIDTPTALVFTVDNVWMDRAPTVHPQTTLAGSIPADGAGSVTVTNGSILNVANTAQNPYALIGGTEIIQMSSIVGNTANYIYRGMLGTQKSAHAAGETFLQIKTQPTGPVRGPFSTMTADLTPRRVQNFKPANGATVTCTVTPFGSSAVTKTATVAATIWTLTGITINATGVTSVSCH